MVKIDSSVVALAEDQIANRTVPNALPAKYLGTAADRHDMLILGKTQQLKRNFDLISMLGFSSTAVISWEIIPVFLVWNLIDGGTPIVFWGLIIGAVGMSFVYASLAEMASMCPTAGGQYHWVSEFAPPSFQKGLSYCVGWLTAIAWQVYLAGTCFIVGSLVQGLIALNNPNYVYHRWHGTLLTIAVVVLSATYNVLLAKRLPILGQLLLVLQVVGLFGTVIPLWVTAPKGQASQVLFEVKNNGGWDNKGLSAMIGLAPIVGVLNGYDCIAHMSEEINDASRVLPIAMISSVSLNIVLLLIMGITLIFCLGDLDNVVNTSTGQPFIQIYYNATQSHSGTSVMVAISITLIVFCGVNEVATSSRQIWAFARDGGLPGWRWLSYVSPKLNVPLRAIGVTFAISCLLSLINIGSSVALNAINSLGSVAVLISYWVTISCLVWRRVRGAPLPARRWSLGKYGLVINIAALVFLVPIIFFFFWPLAQPVTPINLNWSSVMFCGILLVAAVYYFAQARHEYTGPVAQVKREPI